MNTTGQLYWSLKADSHFKRLAQNSERVRRSKQQKGVKTSRFHELDDYIKAQQSPTRDTATESGLTTTATGDAAGSGGGAGGVVGGSATEFKDEGGEREPSPLAASAMYPFGVGAAEQCGLMVTLRCLKEGLKKVKPSALREVAVSVPTTR